ncbi:hypothetical protein NE237_032407 [Protea cynaroides]|uniref:Uncharacterized protein n=1 Tax=Protea cynaroides TaxID=273540 RepID=A0A9Q0R3I0_9MAGN|nr:hypothetical protein NE237_032407 [Protea cynaroides]
MLDADCQEVFSVVRRKNRSWFISFGYWTSPPAALDHRIGVADDLAKAGSISRRNSGEVTEIDSAVGLHSLKYYKVFAPCSLARKPLRGSASVFLLGKECLGHKPLPLTFLGIGPRPGRDDTFISGRSKILLSRATKQAARNGLSNSLKGREGPYK